MTNGEKIIEIVGKKPLIDTFSNPYILFNKNWWNTEYKEPNTKNDFAGEIMDFPNTFEEFANRYGFKDKDEIYTNGSELIPVFRVKQWLEHISTTENDLKFCPDRKAKTTHAEGFLHCIKNDCAAYKDGKCLKYDSKQEPTTKNDLKEVYNKGYEDGVKSVNICPYCGEYIGEEDGNDD